MKFFETIELTQKEFDELPEYSCSLPTGTKIGKRWKKRVPYDGENPVWYLGEITTDPEPGFVGILWKRIKIKSEELPEAKCELSLEQKIMLHVTSSRVDVAQQEILKIIKEMCEKQKELCNYEFQFFRSGKVFSQEDIQKLIKLTPLACEIKK